MVLIRSSTWWKVGLIYHPKYCISMNLDYAKLLSTTSHLKLWWVFFSLICLLYWEPWVYLFCEYIALVLGRIPHKKFIRIQWHLVNFISVQHILNSENPKSKCSLHVKDLCERRWETRLECIIARRSLTHRKINIWQFAQCWVTSGKAIVANGQQGLWEQQTTNTNTASLHIW